MKVKDFKIRELLRNDIKGLNELPPEEWMLNYEKLLLEFMGHDFFNAFVLTHHDNVIGTGNVFISNEIGWLANIIIRPEYRNKGLGYNLTDFLICFLHTKGCKTIQLISTQVGEPLYKKFGFKKMTEYHCFETDQESHYTMDNNIRRIKNSDLDNILELDIITNGENRRPLIQKYYEDGWCYVNTKNEIIGFYLPDFGKGLIISTDKNAGLQLLSLKHSTKTRRSVLPINNESGIAILEKQLKTKRKFTCSRMLLGKEIKWVPNNIYSYGSGYCG